MSFSNILKDAALRGKRKKQDLFNDLVYAIEQDRFNDNLYADLIAYFKPAPPKTAKTIPQWVAKASNPKEGTRTPLRYLYADEGTLIATNGHRLHLAKTDLPNGYYDPASCKPIEHDTPYPDFRRVVPPHDNATFETIRISKLKVKPSASLDYPDVVEFPGKVFIDRGYLLEMANGHDEIEMLTGRKAVDSQMFRYQFDKQNTVEAIIMPVRV